MEYRIDLFSIFIFLGIVQAFFLSFFFLSKDRRPLQALFFNGVLLLSIALCNTEILLMYTGYIQQCLFLVDFSEPVSFVIGPAFYLMVISITRGEVSPRNYLHFLVPVVYAVLLIPFLIAPEDVKYNSWIGAYHPELPFRSIPGDPHPRWLWITDRHTDLTLLSLGIYGGLGLYEVIRAFRNRREPFWSTTHPALTTLRLGLFQIISGLVLVVVVKLFNKNDTGDHLFAAYLSISVYFTSFRVMRLSGFFNQAALTEQQKYKGSTLTAAQKEEIIGKLNNHMTGSRPFLQSDFSLPDLAHALKVSTHQLSQVLNEGLGKTFFEMTAEYRVAEAKRLLREKQNIKVEEIAEQVGYHSKSSFNTVFKKITGTTPSEFRSS